MRRVFVCTLALVCVGMRSIEAVDALESQRALRPVGAGCMGCVKRPASRFLHPALSALRLSGGAGQKRPSTPSKSPNAGKKHAGDDGTDGAEDHADEPPATPRDRSRDWDTQKAGDLEVLSTRESVLKRPDMWIGDVTTVTKVAYEVIALTHARTVHSRIERAAVCALFSVNAHARRKSRPPGDRAGAGRERRAA